MPVALLIGIFVVAAVATLGDWVWYTFDVRHGMAAGIIHGALLLTVVGGALGAAAGRTARGVPIGTLAGIGAALAYYVILALTGGETYGASIPAAWIVMWLLLATLEGRWLRAPQCRSWREIAARGALAALLGGVAFYLELGTLWGAPPERGRNYVVQFAAWTFAWAPGLLALGAGRPSAAGHA